VTPHDKLFIPGPVEFRKNAGGLSRPDGLGIRGEAFKNLYREFIRACRNCSNETAHFSFYFRLGLMEAPP